MKKKKIKKKLNQVFPCVKRTYVLGMQSNNKKNRNKYEIS